jgi:hypothetical protein
MTMMKDLNILNNKFFSNLHLEYITLILFPAIALFVYFQRYYSYLFLALAANIGLISFIALNKNLPNKDLTEPHNYFLNEKSLSANRILSIVYILAYGSSLLTLLDGFYTKTIWYYVFISICSGSIAAEILFFESKLICKTNIIKSVLLFLNLSLSNQILYTLGIGNPDNFYHLNNIVIPIIDQGHIPSGYTYTYFPMHHLLASIASLITNVSPSIIYHCLGATIMSLGPIFAFLVGMKIFDRRIGLFSALVYCCADYIIYWGAHPVQLTYFFPIILMFFMILLYVFKNRNVTFILLYLILCVHLVFLHHYSTLITYFILILILLIEFIQKIEKKEHSIKSFGMQLIFSLMLFAHWIYFSHLFEGFISIIVMYNNAFRSELSSSIVSQTYYDTLPIKSLFISEISSCILIALSIIGFFYLLRNRSFFGDIISGLFVFLIGLIGIGAVISIYFLLPNRLYVFLQELSMLYLVSISIVWILNITNNKVSVKMFILLLFIVLQFFSATSTIAGFETSPFIGNQAYLKFYETPFEKNSLNWVKSNNVENHSIFINPGFVSSSATIYEKWSIEETDGKILVNMKNISANSFLLFSNFDISEGFMYNRVSSYHMGATSYIKIKSNAKDELNGNIQILEIYDNGMLSIYSKYS